MKDIVIVGAGNFGREVAQLVEEINAEERTWNLLGFLDETPEKKGILINGTLVLGGFEWLEKHDRNAPWAVCAIGNPRDKYTLLHKMSQYNIGFANLIHPNARISRFVEIGCGNIICWNSFLSVNTKIGDHVSINPGCGIGHDARIKDYSTLYWNITLSGNVTIGEGCEIGSKAVVIPRTTVGRWSVIGAGAVVVRDLPENCTAVGVPAQPIKRLPPLREKP